MATIRSYTTVEQSRKLAEILPLESADNYYSWHDEQYYVVNKDCPYPYSLKEKIPCLSLAALLNVMPKQFGRYTKSLCWFDDAWHCVYMDEDSECKYCYCVSADNPLDACYEMIIYLNKLNLL